MLPTACLPSLQVLSANDYFLPNLTTMVNVVKKLVLHVFHIAGTEFAVRRQPKGKTYENRP